MTGGGGGARTILKIDEGGGGGGGKNTKKMMTSYMTAPKKLPVKKMKTWSKIALTGNFFPREGINHILF